VRKRKEKEGGYSDTEKSPFTSQFCSCGRERELKISNLQIDNGGKSLLKEKGKGKKGKRARPCRREGKEQKKKKKGERKRGGGGSLSRTEGGKGRSISIINCRKKRRKKSSFGIFQCRIRGKRDSSNKPPLEKKRTLPRACRKRREDQAKKTPILVDTEERKKVRLKKRVFVLTFKKEEKEKGQMT